MCCLSRRRLRRGGAEHETAGGSCSQRLLDNVGAPRDPTRGIRSDQASLAATEGTCARPLCGTNFFVFTRFSHGRSGTLQRLVSAVLPASLSLLPSPLGPSHHHPSPGLLYYSPTTLKSKFESPKLIFQSSRGDTLRRKSDLPLRALSGFQLLSESTQTLSRGLYYRLGPRSVSSSGPAFRNLKSNTCSSLSGHGSS